MGANFLLPLLISAASRQLQNNYNVTDTDILEKRKEEGNKHWKDLIAEWKRRNDQHLRRWVVDGPMGEKDDKWENTLEKMSQKPEREHQIWDQKAWELLQNWTMDDSPSSLFGWGGFNSHHHEGPMIHLTSRMTVNNKTEERVSVVPASSIGPLLDHLATSPLFNHMAPMLLGTLAVVPVFMLLFLVPFIVVPVFGFLFFSMSVMMLFTSGIFALGSGMSQFMDHIVPMVEQQDIDTIFERTGLEDLDDLASTFTTTLSPITELTENNIVGLTEVPRMLWW